MHLGKRGRSGLMALATLFGVYSMAWAQVASGTAPSQVTPSNFLPSPAVRQESGSLLDRSSDDAPVGSDLVFVSPDHYVVSPASAQLDRIVARFDFPASGTRISVAKAFEIASRLEQSFASGGFPLVRIVLPAQSVTDGGTINYLLVNGFIESVDTDEVPVPVRALVRNRITALIGTRSLPTSTLERCLLLAGDIPGLTLRSALVQGHLPGGTILILSATLRTAYGSLSFDNHLPQSLQRWQVGPSLSLSNVFGLGEQFYTAFRSGPSIGDSTGSDPLLRIFAVGSSLPFGSNGFIAGLEYTESRTHPIAGTGAPDVVGLLRRTTVRGSFPLLRSRRFTSNLVSAVEHLEQSSDAAQFGVAISKDRYTVARVSLESTGEGESVGAFSHALSVSRGVTGLQSADAVQSGVPLSRQGTEPSFWKIVGSAQLSQDIPLRNTKVDLSFAAQTALGHAMLQSEQFLLDGSSLVSGLAPGTLSVDAGVAIRAELVHAWLLDLSPGIATLSSYFFAAAGRGTLARPTTVEQQSVAACATGAGMRVDVPHAKGRPGQSFAVEWARANVAGTSAFKRQTLSLSYLVSY